MAHFGSFVYAILTGMFQALTFKLLWAWFIVTTFGTILLTFPQAYGIMLILSLTHLKFHYDEEKYPMWAKLTALNVVSSFIYFYSVISLPSFCST